MAATDYELAKETLRDLAENASDEMVRLEAARLLSPVFYTEGFVSAVDLEAAGVNAIPVYGAPHDVLAQFTPADAPTKED